MDYGPFRGDRSHEIVDLFTDTFTASEGPDEGRLIGALAQEMLATTPEADLHVYTASDEAGLAGCIMFSRLTYPEDERTVFVLAPVAVATGRQGQGVGTALLRHGLDDLRYRGVDVALTYGDPAYYARVGFAPITEDTARPPRALSMPEGWLGQSLTGKALEPLKGPSSCVSALDSPAYW